VDDTEKAGWLEQMLKMKMMAFGFLTYKQPYSLLVNE